MSYETFRRKAPVYMARLMEDFGCTLLDAAAVFGNAGYESGGFEHLQEIRPTVKGSRGGFGWFQWTGPRRRAFEAYCKRNGLNPADHGSNYKWLFVELKGDYRAVMPAVQAAATLYDKVVAFERGFEKAGVKHYTARHEWAGRALKAYQDNAALFDAPAKTAPVPEPPVVIPPPPDVPPVEPAPQDPQPIGFLALLVLIALAGLAATAFILFTQQ